MEQAQQRQVDQGTSDAAYVVIECGNEVEHGVKRRGGCHVPSCDYFGIGDGGGANEGEHNVVKEVVAEVSSCLHRKQ